LEKVEKGIFSERDSEASLRKEAVEGRHFTKSISTFSYNTRQGKRGEDLKNESDDGDESSRGHFLALGGGWP